LAQAEFNVGSPKQVGEILFDKLGIAGGKKSKLGAYSTDASTLEDLAAQGHHIAELILEWRQISKLKSTYTDSLPKQIHSDGRVHTHYAMTSTSTGRLSSTDPNLQNIPIRSEEGNKIRKAFVASEGHVLISADYSQIELRLLAHMADIQTLKKAFKDTLDVHAATASQVFGIPLENITPELRRKAKAINFGIIYGMSAFGLASRLRISRQDAKEYIERYFAQYPGIRHYMDTTIAFAKEHGYVETLFGRKCFIRDIQGKNSAMRQFAERAAINAPLQGTAADIIKKAMITLHQMISKKTLAATMLLQVHDELIFEVPKAQAEEVAKLIQTTMEHAAKLTVPLTVDVGIGLNWADIHA
jgi:DNA polymerase-1